ncbi:MAG: succinic semialdehyde dehydrogenase [Rubrobacteraceae bacterium]
MHTKPEIRISGTSDALLNRLMNHITLADGTREKIAVEAPFTGETLDHVPRCIPEDIEEGARQARAAQEGWAGTSFDERSAIFLRYHDLLLDRQSEVLDLIQQENGKARKHAFEEVLDTAITTRYYANTAERYLKTHRRRGALPLLTAAWEHHHPRGVAGFITPWNYPLTLGITDAIPALLAGNGALIKPDEKTPFSTLWAVDLLYEAGLPRDLAQVVTGYGAELGESLVNNVEFVMFTGSTRVGRIVAGQAAERLIDYSMELGGKNAMIVLDDADLDKTVRGAERAAFSSGGQLCIAMERLYVQSGVYEEFKRRFVGQTRNMKLGPGLDYNADMGSIASAEQLERIQEHVEDAVNKGARILTGGHHRPDLGPYFYEPTVLENVTKDMELCDEETFGPVVSLYKFDTPDEAVALANDSPYGLNFSVWAGDTGEGRGLAARLEAGTVNVNEPYAAAWGSVDAPMGGFKASGAGRRHGAHGIQKYTESQTVAVQRGFPLEAPPGIDEGVYARFMSNALKVLRRVPGIR